MTDEEKIERLGEIIMELACVYVPADSGGDLLAQEGLQLVKELTGNAEADD